MFFMAYPIMKKFRFSLSRRTRIFLAVLAVYTVGMAWLLFRVTSDLDPLYRESAEESQIDIAQLLASAIEQDVMAGAMPLARLQDMVATTLNRRFSAQVYGLHKTRVELRVTVTDRNGIVRYDSTGRSIGADFSGWRDVSLTLQGLYGARTTRDVASDPRSSVLYVAAPVRWGDEIIGVVTVGKPVQSFGQFVVDARERTLWVGMASASFLLVFALILSFWLIRPFGLVRDMWHWLRRQSFCTTPTCLPRSASASWTTSRVKRNASATRWTGSWSCRAWRRCVCSTRCRTWRCTSCCARRWRPRSWQPYRAAFASR